MSSGVGDRRSHDRSPHAGWRDRWRTAVARVRRGAGQIVEGTAAATLAWVLDVELFHHTAPFFAPAAALITIGATRGQRVRRAVDLVLGVAVGVLIADVLARALAPHVTLSILVIIGLTLLVATAFGGGPILTVQAAVSATYVVVVTPPGGGLVS